MKQQEAPGAAPLTWPIGTPWWRYKAPRPAATAEGERAAQAQAQAQETGAPGETAPAPFTPVTAEEALVFLRACGYDPVRAVIRRRGRVYSMWAERRTHRKLLADWQLAHMDLEALVRWLRERSPAARVLFPQPEVYRRAGQSIAGHEREEEAHVPAAR